MNKIIFENIKKYHVAIFTCIGALGGFPKLPKIIERIFENKLINWLMVYILIYQGGGNENIIVSSVITIILYIIFMLLYKYDKYNEKKNRNN
jgi:hypothetical protein